MARGTTAAWILGAMMVAAAAPVQADVVRLALGAAAWNAEPSGDFKVEDNTRIDVEDDLGMGSETTGFVWARLEHPVPILPNVKVRYTPLDIEGDETLSRQVVFDNRTFNVNEDVDSTLDMDMVDTALYYEVLDNIVSLDLGLNIKLVDGSATMRSDTTGEDSVDFTAPIPMLYAAAAAELPLTGLSAEAELSGIGYGGNKALDAVARVRYTFFFGLGLELGYRTLVVDVDTDDVDVDVDVSGLVAGAHFDF